MPTNTSVQSEENNLSCKRKRSRSGNLRFCITTVRSSTEFQYNSPLDTENHFTLEWTIYSDRLGALFQYCYTDDVDIVEKTNIIGIGFSKRGSVELADVFIAWKKGPIWKSQDMHTTSSAVMRRDRRQNYKLMGIVFKHQNQMCLTFYRKFQTEDADDYCIDSGTTHVLSFAGSHWLPLDQPDLLRLDSFQPNVQRIQIIKAPIPKGQLPHNTRVFELTLENVKVPDAETTYWCKVVLLPDMPEPEHIIKYEGVISQQSVGIVHHMEIFHCESPPDRSMKHYNAPCNSETKPRGLLSCRKVIGAWAMGAKGLEFPTETGFLIGGKNYLRYVVIEVHFNNPNRKSGIIDSSGIRFYTTRQLRRYNAGILELGLEYNAKNSIPPGQKNFTLSGFCTSDCTGVALPKSGINIFASQLHTHLTGRQVVTEHYRAGRRLRDLNSDYQYSPHFQEIRLLQKPVHVKRGDALVTRCTHNTVERREMTFGGLSIHNEMCVNYVFYYPKIDLEVCKSTVSDDELSYFFKYMKMMCGAATSDEKSIEENYSAIEWNINNVNYLKKFYSVADIHQSCNSSAGFEILEADWSHVRPTLLKKSTAQTTLSICHVI